MKYSHHLIVKFLFFSNFRTNLRSESRLYASIFIVSLFTNISRIYNVNKFITKLTMISFSTGSDSAIINVIATNEPSLIFLFFHTENL